MTCLFCNIAAGQSGELIYQDSHIVAFNDIAPQAPVHLLIIPRRHVETLNQINIEDMDLLGKMILIAKQLAEKNNIAESGYRLVFNCNRAGGQVIFHIHLHLLGGRSMQWPPG